MWKTGVIVLFWGLLALTSGELQPEENEHRKHSTPGKLDFGYVPAGVYETMAHYEPGVIGVLFHMVHAFLCVVQPNPFPQDLVVKVTKDKFGAIQSEYQKPENVVLTLQVMYYELGFLICAGVGVLFAVLLPLVGLFFCMCRCCDNCGGEMHQRQRKNAECQRGLLASLLIAALLVITAGVVCAYAANQNLSSQLKSMRKLVNSNLRDLQTFANQTPTQVEYLISQYATAKTKVIHDLDNVGPLLGGRIHAHLGEEVRPALDGALAMAAVKIEKAIKAMRDTQEALENMSAPLEVLQTGGAKLASNLSLVRSLLRRTLAEPGCRDDGAGGVATPTLCRGIGASLAQLHVGANFSRLPNVSEPLASLDVLLQTDLSGSVQKGYSSLGNTPAMVTDQTRDIVEGVRGLLDGIGGNITGFSRQFPVQSTLANFTIFISHTHSRIEDSYPQVDKMDFYRWLCCIALCSMVVLVLAFSFLGLLCGTVGYDKHASPTTRGCVSNTGGTLLMAAVGLSFLFSWALMGVVAAAFVVGGNAEKLLCEPFHSKQLFKVVDEPFLVHAEWKNFIPGFLYNDSDLDLTLDRLYSDCKENKGIYSAMHLDKVFNISTFLNSTMYTKGVARLLDKVKIDLRGVVLLEAEGRQNLLDFSQSAVTGVDYAAYLEEVNKGVTMVDLLSYADELEAQTDLMPPGSLQTSLKGHANTLRQIHSQQVIPMEQAMTSLNQSIRLLDKTTSDLPNKIMNVLSAIEAAQYLISQNATHIVNQETEEYKRTIVGYFNQYIDWVKTSLALEVAACKPFSNLVDTAEIVACSVLVDSMNAFWFGLGCSALFLLPSIILSVKLAKFYRRMDTEDVYDDIPAYDTMARFPRASAPPRHIDW